MLGTFLTICFAYHKGILCIILLTFLSCAKHLVWNLTNPHVNRCSELVRGISDSGFVIQVVGITNFHCRNKMNFGGKNSKIVTFFNLLPKQRNSNANFLCIARKAYITTTQRRHDFLLLFNLASLKILGDISFFPPSPIVHFHM